MEKIISILKNTKKVYLLALLEKPFIVNNEWSVIMQQKFNGYYLVLIKKVCCIIMVIIKTGYKITKLVFFRL